jgi:hypothetical protein
MKADLNNKPLACWPQKRQPVEPMQIKISQHIHAI